MAVTPSRMTEEGVAVRVDITEEGVAVTPSQHDRRSGSDSESTLPKSDSESTLPKKEWQ